MRIDIERCPVDPKDRDMFDWREVIKVRDLGNDSMVTCILAGSTWTARTMEEPELGDFFTTKRCDSRAAALGTALEWLLEGDAE